MKGKINIIFGTTASGKTDYAVKLAERLDGEIINCDSMQVYKDIPIITAQPTQKERRTVVHHLFGYIEPINHCNVGTWLKDAVPVIKDIQSRGKTPILVGGTGMYIKALVEGLDDMPVISDKVKEQLREYQKLEDEDLFEILKKLDEKSAKTLSHHDTQRILRSLAVVLETGKSIIDFKHGRKNNKNFAREDFYLIWINRDREEIYKRINTRFDIMMDTGVLKEVKALVAKYGFAEFPRAHGLPEMLGYLKDEMTLQNAIEHSKKVTRHYAKRQITWAKHQMEFDEVLDSI